MLGNAVFCTCPRSFYVFAFVADLFETLKLLHDAIIRVILMVWYILDGSVLVQFCAHKTLKSRWGNIVASLSLPSSLPRLDCVLCLGA